VKLLSFIWTDGLIAYIALSVYFLDRLISKDISLEYAVFGRFIRVVSINISKEGLDGLVVRERYIRGLKHCGVGH